MRSINNTLIGNQMRMQYNYVSKCDEQYKQLTSIIQNGTDNCSCSDYSEQLNKIETIINDIKTSITNITTNLTSIEEKLEQIKQSLHSTSTEETVTLSIQTPTAVRSTESSSPNTVAFDSLLAEVEEMTTSAMDDFYSDYISPVIAKNKYNLLSPIPVADLCSCTKIPELNTSAFWENLEDENKRAYIMQFILANRSNSTRAMYLTNQLIGAFALPL